MKILNFGSLNLDFVYSVDHIAKEGETLSSNSLQINYGGKGLNQSIALAKAGVCVYHAGKIGSDGAVLAEELEKYGVRTEHIHLSEKRTGNAIIQIDRYGQNSIILYGGANRNIDLEMIRSTLSFFSAGDYLLLQNEINSLDVIMEQAHEIGMKIILNPSPADDFLQLLPLHYVDLFVLNEIEGQAISGFKNPEDILSGIRNRFPKSNVLLTLGEHGAYYQTSGKTFYQDIFKTNVADTTAAGDTFTGYFVAGMFHDLSIEQSLSQASRASSIAVSRLGAAASIPYLAEVTSHSQ